MPARWSSTARSPIPPSRSIAAARSAATAPSATRPSIAAARSRPARQVRPARHDCPGQSRASSRARSIWCGSRRRMRRAHKVTRAAPPRLAGTVQAAFASGTYATRAYTILSAAGGLGGTTFNSLTTTNLPAGFAASLSYTNSEVILNLTAQLHTNADLAPMGLTPIRGTSPPRSTISSTTAARCRPTSSVCSD